MVSHLERLTRILFLKVTAYARKLRERPKYYNNPLSFTNKDLKLPFESKSIQGTKQ